ncbi:MAG: glycoside hydrolase family 2, partial [Clostridiales bacterium]|nr:glycoside hydrolase family 2 [Clostridiales bacterium]
MKKLDLNRGWLVKHEGTEEPGKPVNLPHDAMLGEPRTAQSPGGTNTGWFEGHDYRYTRTLDVPEDWRGKAAVLECEGVYHNATVLLNGEAVGFRPYGYTNFYVDLTEQLRYGQANTLEVVARNADQPNSRWYSGSGLYRPVWLYLSEGADYLPPNAIRVKTLGIDPAQVEITVATQGTGTVSVQILDGGRQIAAFEGESNGKVVFRATLRGAKLWSPESPSLYTCRAAFAGDTAETSFGIRTLAWGPEEGLTLNGKRVILRGACIHHDNGVLGACAYPEAEERKIRLLQENGYNAIRSAHNPCSKALLDACDRLGMLVMDEFVDCWYIHKTQHDYVTYFEDWWRQDLTDLVEKDYNHPSVILYSTGNEVSETAQKKGIALTRQMTDFLHTLDGTRPVTCGINIFFNLLSSMGFGVYSDDKAQKQADVEKPKAVGSQFFNDLAGLLGSGTMKTGATLHGCDLKTRDAFAAMDMAGYNYGIKRYRHDLKKYPDRLILGSETFCSDAYQFWELAKQEPRLIGDVVWAGMDNLGEVGSGAWEYQD